MSGSNEFQALMAKVCGGDQRAAAELVSRYEPLIRREVRLRLEDRRLARVFDSMDVCQSVLASFFVRAAAGQYDLDDPGQLVHLLVTMARNKVASRARQQYRQRRDQRREAGGAAGLENAVGDDPSPSRVLEGKELLAAFLGRLSEDERRIAELRGQGLAWDEVAQQLGGTAGARRMQLARAAERIARDLGLEEGGDE
jgi:RNA polymerase sigma-70 factor (ECF subfamily)